MKKLIFAVIATLFVCSATTVMADPGPYDATMTVDGYDGPPNNQGDGADAVPTPNQTGGVQTGLQVFDAINKVFSDAGVVVAALGSNAASDFRQVTTANAYWHQIAPVGDAGNFAVISIAANNLNTLGVFKFGDWPNVQYVVPEQTGLTFLGDGSFGDPYPGGINPLPNDNFGFALRTKLNALDPGIVWSSDPVFNSDGIDHMLAYYLPELNGKSAWIDTDGDLDADEEIFFSTDSYLLAWEDLNLNDPQFDSDYNDTIFLVTKVAPVPEPLSMGLLGSGLAAMLGFRRRKIA